MRVLVTGGAGFIGSHLVEALVARGDTVRVLDDFSTGQKANLAAVRAEVELVRGDIQDREALRAACDGIELAYHEAAFTSVIRSFVEPEVANAINITGTFLLLDACRQAGVRRLVLASSSSVYGDTDDLPKRESHLPKPLSPYGLGKLAGEHYCRLFSTLYDLETVVLRYFNVYGPRQDPNSEYAAVIPKFIDAIVHDRTPVVFGDGEQTRDFTYVKDVVAANLAAGTVPLTEPAPVFNVACGNSYSINDLLEKLGTIVGRTIAADYQPERPGEVRHSRADTGRLNQTLTLRAFTAFADGLEETVRWATQR